MAYSLKLDNDLFDDRYLNERQQMSQARWPNGPSGHSGCDGRPIFIPETGLYGCHACDHTFNPLEGIVLRHYRLSFPQLTKAMQAVRKHGVDTSPTALASDLGVTYATARKLLMRIQALPEFGGVTPAIRPYRKRKPDEMDRRVIKLYDELMERYRGYVDAYEQLAEHLESLNPNFPTLSEDYNAGLKHGLKWTAKIARQRAEARKAHGLANPNILREMFNTDPS